MGVVSMSASVNAKHLLVCLNNNRVQRLKAVADEHRAVVSAINQELATRWWQFWCFKSFEQYIRSAHIGLPWRYRSTEPDYAESTWNSRYGKLLTLATYAASRDGDVVLDVEDAHLLRYGKSSIDFSEAVFTLTP
jgi:hypothetical protein